MPGHVEIEWSFEPATLLEEQWNLDCQGVQFSIGFDGVVSARIEGYEADGVRTSVEHAQRLLEGLLRGAQLVEGEAFTLKVTAIRGYSDPSSTHHVAIGFVIGATVVTKTGRIDAICTDATGRVTSDTKRARIDRKRLLAQRFVTHQEDRTLQRMLRSFDRAVRDRDDALIHLWEIREAFRSKVAGADRALYKAHEPTCERLDKLCNHEPLLEGRHRGKHPEVKLRHATTTELQNARAWASGLIEVYTEWLAASC